MVILPKDSKLRQNLIIQMALHSPFSASDIDSAYDKINSLDRVIEFIETATQQGYSSLLAYTDFYFQEERRNGRFLEG